MALSPETAEIIRRKKTQYGRFSDTKQWHLFNTIALPDATFKFVESDGNLISQGGIDLSWSSRDDFVAYFKEALGKNQTIHSFGPGELEQTGPNEVTAIWTCVYHSGPEGSTDIRNHGTGGGHYHEIWKKQGVDWFLADLKFQRLYWVVRD